MPSTRQIPRVSELFHRSFCQTLDSEEIVCDAPIKTVSFKLSLNYVHEDGKPCTTIFNLLSYDGTTSLVRCRPLTGRTHQIRVHLRYLGYPIPNDPLYGNASHWASMLRPKEPMTEDEAKLLVEKLIKESKFDGGEWDETQADVSVVSSTSPTSPTTTDPKVTTEAPSTENKVSIADNAVGDTVNDTATSLPRCPECSISLMKDPRPEELFIWLHAWRYAGDGWAYETELPDWAKEVPQKL